MRDNLRLERLFEEKKSKIMLQDILDLKEVHTSKTHSYINDAVIKIDGGNAPRTFPLFHDSILDVDYFYGRIPISWLENDDERKGCSHE
jgi:hypothetical protein